MPVENYQQLYHLLIESYIYHDKILRQNDLQKQFNHTILELYIDQEQNKKQIDKYQKLYHIS